MIVLINNTVIGLNMVECNEKLKSHGICQHILE